MSKSRIDYIDLLKGFAMIMVLAYHSGVILPDWLHYPIKMFRMPLYFFLAGMFITGRSSTLDFCIRKINRLIIPGVFFSLLYMILKETFTDQSHLANVQSVLPSKIHLVYLYFTQTTIGNGPVWFLWCMFSTTIIHLIIVKSTSGKPFCYPAAISLICGVAGLIMANHAELLYQGDFRIPLLGAFTRFICLMHIPVAFLIQPLVCLGNFAARHNFHSWQPSVRVSIAVLAVSGFIASFSYLSPNNSLVHHSWTVEAYVLSLASISFFVILAKHIQKIPIVNYIGKYSLIALLIHTPIHLVVGDILQIKLPSFYFFLLTLLLTVLSIYPLKRWLPWFTGQADLIRRPQWLPRFFSAAES